jgi:hypothetical protein
MAEAAGDLPRENVDNLLCKKEYHASLSLVRIPGMPQPPAFSQSRVSSGSAVSPVEALISSLGGRN